MMNNIKLNFIFTKICLLLFFKIGAQVSKDGLYVSKSTNEFMCIKDDTLSFRLHNSDAFSTYTLFLGTFSMNYKAIRIGENRVANTTSIIEEKSGKSDLCRLQFFDSENNPIRFAQITLSGIKNKTTTICKFTTDEGYTDLFKEEVSKLLDSTVKIKVETLDFCTEQVFTLELGKIYSIKSKVPKDIPFLILERRDVVYYTKNVNGIIVKAFNNRKIILERFGECKSCQEELFKSYPPSAKLNVQQDAKRHL